MYLETKINNYLNNECELWKMCGDKQKIENNKNNSTNLDNLKSAIIYAVEKTEKIANVFQEYTDHGFQHSKNVLNIMAKLLQCMNIKVDKEKKGKDKKKGISSYEIALLILSAFFHDIGMSVLEGVEDVPKEDNYKSWICRNEYYVEDKNKIKKYIRDCHHLRIKLFLEDYNLKKRSSSSNKDERSYLYWIDKSGNKQSFSMLEDICISHNEGEDKLNKIDNTQGRDGRFCAILLRLADILDLDNTRAPLDKMTKEKFANSLSGLKSLNEWRKHRATEGAIFEDTGMVKLEGETEDIVVYQKIQEMVTWIKQEIELSYKVLIGVSEPFRKKWLPKDIICNVKTRGFIAEPYTYTVAKNEIIKLFMSENLYMDKMVFMRELLQNAIDATIYYQKLKENEKKINKNSSCCVQPLVDIHIWNVKEDVVSFLIKDNGTGMNEALMTNYFLKIGKSFYQSEQFKNSNVSFMPISRFGVGFLSVFLITEKIEVVTKYYHETGIWRQITLKKEEDYYALRTNYDSTGETQIKKKITDWENDEVNLSDFIDKDSSGTLIYFEIKKEIIQGDMDCFARAFHKYFLSTLVKVKCNVAGTQIEFEEMPKQFMNAIKCKLCKNYVMEELHIKNFIYSSEDDIIFESFPLILQYERTDGKINGRLQIMTIYDTGQRRERYRFKYFCDYDDDSFTIILGQYHQRVDDVKLNDEYKVLGISNQVKLYFNGIYHLSDSESQKNDSMKSSYCNGYIALEGIYRPEVDVTRSGKGYLDLQTLACLNYLYLEQIQSYVKDDLCKRSVFFSLPQPEVMCYATFDKLQLNNYQQDIEGHKWEDLSFIKTEKGFLSIHEIQELIANNDKEIELFEDITVNEMPDFRRFIITYLVDKYFDIILRVNDGVDRVYIKRKTTEVQNCGLPPMFFVFYDNMEVLKQGNYPLNREHWFSKWFLQKAKEEGFMNDKNLLIQELQRNIINSSKSDEVLKNINTLILKYGQKELIEPDIIPYIYRNKNIRGWLQVD